MNGKMRTLYISKIKECIEHLNGSEFEKFGYIILGDIVSEILHNRGTTIDGQPVGNTVDSYSDDGLYVGEYSVEKNYFISVINNPDSSKMYNDIKHASETFPDVERIYLFAGVECSPKTASEVTLFCNKQAKIINKIILWMDSREIAEYIVDNMLEKNNTVEKFELFLPVIAQMYDENINDCMLPDVPDNFSIDNNIEKDAVNIISTNKILYLSGISGIGKTVLASYIARKISSSFDSTFFINGSKIESTNQLGSIEYEMGGSKFNLLGTLNRRKMLVIIDDLQKDLYSIINKLNSNIKNDSKIIITSQTKINEGNILMELTFPQKDSCKEILNYDLNKRCPEDIFRAIYQKTNGHPMLLNVINKMIKSGFSWSDIKEDMKHLSDFEVSNAQTISDRLISRHKQVLNVELAALKWLDTNYINKSLLDSLIGKIGIKKLDDRSFITNMGSNIFKVHDIILGSIKKTCESKDFQELFFDFFKKHKYMKDSNYFRSLYLHKIKVLNLCSDITVPGINLYLYLQIYDSDELDICSHVNYKYLLSDKYTYSTDKYYELLSVIEMYENKFREIKRTKGKDEALRYLTEAVNEAEKMVNISKLDDNIELDLLHHIGKFYIYLGQKEHALKTFNYVLGKNSKAYETQLQIARIIMQENKMIAQKIYLNILDGYINFENISMSVVLAAYEDIRRFDFGFYSKYYFDHFIEFKRALLSMAIEQFDQPYRVLATISKIFTYEHSRLLLEILNEMPLPSVEEVEEKYAFAVGQLYKEAGKSLMWNSQEDVCIVYFKQAELFYNKLKVKNDFEIIQIAENYNRLGEYDLAINELNSLIQCDDIYGLHRYAEALNGKKEYDEALNKINLAIQKVDSKSKIYESAFFQLKGNILYHLGHCTWIDWYYNAMQSATGEKYKKQLTEEMEQMKQSLK